MARRILARRALVFLFVLVVSLVTLLPFYIMVVMGTYYTNDLFKGIVVRPGNYLLQNMKTIVENRFFTFYFNSAYLATVVTALSLLVNTLAGYAFAMYQFRHKNALFNGILSTMMIPSTLGLIAYVVEMRMLGVLNTHLPLIFGSIASAYGVFWMRQYIKGGVPREVIESARMDGSGELRTFFMIALPFIRPALASLGLLFFLWNWNSYLLPLIVLTRVESYTVPLGIGMLSSLYRADIGAQILGLTISTIPIICLFVLFSRNLIRGLTAVAVKG